MRQVYSGMPYLIGGLARKVEVVWGNRKVSIDSLLRFLFQYRMQRKLYYLEVRKSQVFAEV